MDRWKRRSTQRKKEKMTRIELFLDQMADRYSWFWMVLSVIMTLLVILLAAIALDWRWPL